MAAFAVGAGFFLGPLIVGWVKDMYQSYFNQEDDE
jgi:hypothetical protein